MNKKIISISIIVVALSVAFFVTSCKKADINFGEEFLDNNITQIFKTDSFSVDISTVYLDSFVTSNTGVIMAGAYTDPLFGKITTKSFFEVIPPIYLDQYANTSFDSLTIIFKPAFKSYYGDTTQPLNITINELADSIYFPENVYQFYNTSSFNAKPTPLVSQDVMIRPLKGDQVEMKLPNALGNDFLSRLKSPTDISMRSSAAFLSYFKGMRISTNASANLIMGFTDNVSVRLYYKKQDLITQNKTVDFTLANRSHQFNNISINRSGAIQNIGPNNKVIHSSLTGNAAFGQTTTGSMIKMTFPTLKSILKAPNFAKVLKAGLYVYPVKGSYSTTYSLPSVMRLSYTNVNNTIGYDLAYVNTNGSLAVQLGLLNTDYFVGENTFYQYDLTEYVKDALRTTNIVPGEGLLFTPPSPNFSTLFSRVAIGNKNNSLGKIQLQIFYAAVK